MRIPLTSQAPRDRSRFTSFSHRRLARLVVSNLGYIDVVERWLRERRSGVALLQSLGLRTGPRLEAVRARCQSLGSILHRACFPDGGEGDPDISSYRAADGTAGPAIAARQWENHGLQLAFTELLFDARQLPAGRYFSGSVQVSARTIAVAVGVTTSVVGEVQHEQGGKRWTTGLPLVRDRAGIVDGEDRGAADIARSD